MILYSKNNHHFFLDYLDLLFFQASIASCIFELGLRRPMLSFSLSSTKLLIVLISSSILSLLQSYNLLIGIRKQRAPHKTEVILLTFTKAQIPCQFISGSMIFSITICFQVIYSIILYFFNLFIYSYYFIYLILCIEAGFSVSYSIQCYDGSQMGAI